MKVKILKPVVVGVNRYAKAGDVVDLADGTAKDIIGYGYAEKHVPDPVAPEPSKKAQGGEGEDNKAKAK